MTLRRFVMNGGKVIPRGAIARVSDHLGVHPSTVRNWLSDRWKPGADRQKEIDAMIAARISLAPDYRRCGRPKKVA